MIAALALAGALAMFVFGASQPVAAQTTSGDVTRGFSATRVAADGTVSVDVTITLHSGALVEVAETLPDDWTYQPGSARVGSTSIGDAATVNGKTISFSLTNLGAIVYTATAPSGTTGAHTFSGMYAVSGTPDIAIGGSLVLTVPSTDSTGGDDGDADGTIKLSSQTPGAAVQITIKSSAAVAVAIEPNQDITVDFKDTGFGLPSTIADSSIDISSDGFTGSPNNVVVSGDKVTLTVPNVKANGDDQTKRVVGDYEIRIKQSAGITNPAAGGEKTIKWQENAPDPDREKEATVMINRVITLSKKDGTRGTATTATFKGFANGTATIYLNGKKLGEVTIADNLGTYELDTTSAKFLANEDNVITAQDAGGTSQNVSATFTIKPRPNSTLRRPPSPRM